MGDKSLLRNVSAITATVQQEIRAPLSSSAYSHVSYDEVY